MEQQHRFNIQVDNLTAIVLHFCGFLGDVRKGGWMEGWMGLIECATARCEKRRGSSDRGFVGWLY